MAYLFQKTVRRPHGAYGMGGGGAYPDAEKLKNAVMVHVRFPVAGRGGISRGNSAPFRKMGLQPQQVAFRFNGGAAAHAGGGNGLAVVRVRHVSGGERVPG